MKEIEIDQNSRLYRWMQLMGTINDWEVANDQIDSCSFVRAVFFAALTTLVMSALSSVIVYGVFMMIGDLCAWLIASYVFGSWIIIDTYAAFGLLSLLSLLAISLTYIIYLVAVTARNHVRKLTSVFTISIPSTPSIVSELYDSFKKKYCKKIKFKEEN